MERREPGIADWLSMLLLGAALFAYGTVSARTGLPPQPETVVGPAFDQAVGVVVGAFGAVGLLTAVVARRRRRARVTVAIATADARSSRHARRRAEAAARVPPPAVPEAPRRHRRAPSTRSGQQPGAASKRSAGSD